VLRFYGYFKESVVESRLENFRIRKLIILYHLEDHSIMIIEPKETNSGTPQGTFLKR
jgi:EF-hand domain-containing protein 1